MSRLQASYMERGGALFCQPQLPKWGYEAIGDVMQTVGWGRGMTARTSTAQDE